MQLYINSEIILDLKDASKYVKKIQECDCALYLYILFISFKCTLKAELCQNISHDF